MTTRMRSPLCLLALSWCALVTWEARSQAQLVVSTDSVERLQPVAATASTEATTQAIAMHGRVDATLNDLVALAEDRVLAVGDRGAIVSTSSSGRNWELLASPTTANLHGIAFLNSDTGLIVGGWIGSDTRTSHGVVLQSTNGGRSWRSLEVPDLPRLLGLHVLGERCLAWGDYSPHWKTCLFESLDGGLNWRGIDAPLVHAATAGVAANGQWLAIDRLGRSLAGQFMLPNVAQSRLPSSAQLTDANRPLNCLVHTGHAWLAAGNSGELITSSDGQLWQNVDLPLSDAARQLCRWQRIAQIGSQVWICGNPGSIVLYSPDLGRSWQVFSTGQTLPLTSIRFVDSNRGWATGVMGLILATRDGGRTWYAQRERAKRLGVMAIGNFADSIPWGPLVAAAWDEQVAVAAQVYQSVDAIEQANFTPTLHESRRDAGLRLGLAACEASRVAPGSSSSQVEQGIFDVLCWRPDVLLIGQQLEQSSTEQNQLNTNALAMLKACAAPPPHLVRELQLPAWQITKLATTCSDEQGQYTEQSARVLRQPGVSIWDCLLPLSATDRQAAHMVSLRTMWALSQSKSVSASLLGGIAPSPATQRQVGLRNLGKYQLIMGRSHRAKSLELLAEEPIVSKPLELWITDFEFVLQAIPDQEAQPLLQQLVRKLNSGQHWDKCRAIYGRLNQSGRQSEAAEWARLQWLSLELSDERMAWASLSQPVDPSGTSFAGREDFAKLALSSSAASATVNGEPWSASPFAADSPLIPISSGSVNEDLRASGVVAASAEIPISSSRSTYPAQTSVWSQLVEDVRQQSPKLLARPDVQLVLAAHPLPNAQRETKPLEPLLGLTAMIGWSQMAGQEIGWSMRPPRLGRWVATAHSTTEIPVLDGVLDDACWQSSSGMELTSLAPGDQASLPSSIVQWAYDDRYLYVAITAPHQPSCPGPSLVARRGRDADLSQVDHVQFVLDTDRDYATAIELAVSADGRTYDRCCGAAAYNPKWYVIVQSTLQRWTAEVAVELSQLTTRPAVAGEAWAMSARRIHPQGTSQSWSQLRSHAPYLHASGLLRFESNQASE